MAVSTTLRALLLLTLLTLPMLTPSGLSFVSRRRFNTRRRLWARWRQSGLFVRRSQVHGLQTNRTLTDLFRLDTTQVAFPLEGTCERDDTATGGDHMMPACDEDSDSLALLTSSILGCCRTVMQVEFPQTVTSVLTGLRHQVLQFSTSSQLVHTGRCETEGAGCVLGGSCTTFSRIQWLLVRGLPLASTADDDSTDDDDDQTTTVVSPAVDLFVPVMVPNHCQCLFS
ncbi:uncharacterized protein LOC143297500 [Babylonia areolata]|uniref:uncharacterized protein LOC143297500 n=1 Tax=Babylonia areolata TaxID=304850 RepID=UPI003FD33FC3